MGNEQGGTAWGVQGWHEGWYEGGMFFSVFFYVADLFLGEYKTYDAAGELNVLRHDGHALGVDRAEVGVLEQSHQVSLGRLLQAPKTHPQHKQ